MGKPRVYRRHRGRKEIMNSGGNTGPGCVVSVLVSCDRLISPGYGKGIGNRPFSLFPVETLIENFATCGLRPTGWPVTSSRCVTGRIGARSVPNLNLDPRTIRHASFRRGSRPRLPPSLPWMGNIEGMDEKLETIPVVETHVRLTRTLFYLVCLFLFLSILVPSFFPSSRNSIRVSVRLKENGILRFTGIVSLLLTSIRVLLLLLLFFYISGGLLLS